ncbi:hypothetical protein [Nocardia carnea]|uniref:hypothetical protein n=1 Tax=Nocardia carnea TaxID=37328 RepID=UPI0024555FD1|nr:hypothetical protein [Nocardia carnea]
MNRGSGHPLVYPLSVTIGAFAVLTAWAPFADSDQLSALAVVGLGIAGYTGYRLAVAFGGVRHGAGTDGTAAVRRVRQEFRLQSRSWLELRVRERVCWVPVYFTPELVGFTGGTAELDGSRIVLHGSAPDRAPDERAGDIRSSPASVPSIRVLPAGRVRLREPHGRLLDNPSRPDPSAPERAHSAARILRRLLLDAQSVVAAPLIGLMWVYVAGGGLPAFTGATCVAAAAAIWLSAIRGSDPT